MPYIYERDASVAPEIDLRRTFALVRSHLLSILSPLGCWLLGVFGETRWFGTIVRRRGSSGAEPKQCAHNLLHQGGATLRLIV